MMVVGVNEQEDGVNKTANALHPGGVSTNLFRHMDVFGGNYSGV